MIKRAVVNEIKRTHFKGSVYNIELESNVEEDDLFWCEYDTGIFTHNCFPKDINALMSVARQYDVKPSVMQAAWDKNLEVRGPDDRDWEKQIGRAVSKRKQQ